MKDREVTKENWQEYQIELDNLYEAIPNKLKGTVGRIVELELELENISNA